MKRSAPYPACTFRDLPILSGAASPTSSFPGNDERASLFRATEPPERHRARNQLLVLHVIDEASLRIVHLAVLPRPMYGPAPRMYE
jgi:hypothetical protein